MTQFLIDAQLPPALARWLTAHGHPSQHVFDFGGDGTTDDEVWTQARQEGAIIVTKDEDFALRAMRDVGGPSVGWIRVGNTRRAALLTWLAELLPSVINALDQGERIVEID
jgi:predicted nuclease of predicted toxin-antitoxin system